MQLQLEISFRNVDHSDAIAKRAREEAEKLDRFFEHIMSCRVVIEAPHHHKGKGNLYRVAIHMTVPPGETIDVTHAGRKNQAHQDVYVALRDAFKAAARQLEDHVRRIDGRVKAHEPPLHGKVRRIFHERGFGFIETSDGQEVYFHRNSVVGDLFDELAAGSEVRLAVAHSESAEGPQATTVLPLGKHHIVG